MIQEIRISHFKRFEADEVIAYIIAMGGAGELGEAKRHFSALGIAFPTLHGLCLLDRDRSAGPEAQDFPSGLRLLRWNRYEIENYLIARTMRPDEVHPEIIEKLDEIAGMLPPPAATEHPIENNDDDAS